MRFGILGTGMVGRTIGTKLLERGHEVRLGGRGAPNDKASAWASAGGPSASYGTFTEAAAFGEVVWNCTRGDGSVDAVRAARDELAGKVLVDVSNPLDFSKGMPPFLFVSGTDSLAEQLQREVPETQVVKAINTVNANVMVEPGRIQDGEHDAFVSGNDADAKKVVTNLLTREFGWKHVTDLGNLSTARGTEAYLLLWLRLWGSLKTADFNVRVVR